MENGLVEMAPSPASDPTTKFANMARERRRVWAQSRDSLVQTSKPEPSVPTGSQQSQSNGDTQRHPGEPGQDPNKIVSWLIDCSTPTRGSVDDQSASPIRGALRNGCSFEDDLSLGAEANHLQSTNNKSETSFGLAADQKRSQYKERGRSMNSTGSGKSSTVSSVSELLDLYEEDPEEILLNLGFGREEPDLSSKVPSRFFGSSSSARGIDIKVFLGAQMQRMELENPNYALTSRFRQIEVLTTVANEFFQLYSQVSGQPVRRISKEQGEGEEEGGGGGGNDEDQSPMLKRNNSALNVAKFLKKTLTRHNLLSAASESPGEASPNQDKQQKENATTPNPAHINGHKQSGPEQGRCGSGSDHQGEVVSQKQIRKKDNRLEMVIEETSGGGETDQPLDSNPEQSGSGPEHQPESADLQTTNQRKEVEGNQVAKEETNITSPPVTAASSLAPLNLVQLCTENADSFDIEEIQTNEDEALPHRISRTTDFSRTVSQQSDSSGFAEEPSVDSNSNLKVQESSDSCDSETTVTSHPSQDVATPHALDQPAFDLPDGKKEEGELGDAANTDGRSRSSEEDTHGGSSEQVPQYTVHHLLKDQPAGEGEQVDVRDIINPDTEHQPELEHTQNEPEQEPQHSEMTADTETPTKGPEDMPLDNSGSLAPSSPVLDALNRAKRNQLCLMGQNSIQSTDMSQTPGGGGRGRGRRIIPMQRSSSLPSSLLLPSKVVSSVKIQFRQGQASCTPPRYSFKYTQEAGEEVKEDDEEEKQTNCLSTVIINPRSKENPSAGFSPKPVSPNLLQSSCSLHSTSPPAHLSAGGHTQPWSTQSVPDLTFSHHQPGPFNQNQQIWSPGQGMYPTQSPSTVFSDPSPYPSPNFNSGLFPFSTYPYVRPPYLTNQHNLSLNHYSSLTSLHQPLSPLIPAHSNNLHQPPVSTAPYHQGLGHLRSGTSPAPHQVYSHQGYSHPYSHHLPYPITPHNSQYSSPYQGTPVFNMSPLFHSGLGPSAASGLEPGRCQSSTEMQLRKVLHEIRGTVQSLNQSRVNTPDTFSDLRGTSQQSLAEFQQKRRSLNIFRSQMMDLELAVMRQEALVYKHLSPADRLEAEQLQSLRSAVRQELQELEQQVEDHLMDLTSHLHDTALHRNSSFDNLSTASALRAMEPVSDLLRQQFFLQSELIYDGHGSASDPSARSPSPIRGDEADGKQRQGVYRASVNITPAPPPRPNTNTEEDEGEREEDDRREERAEEDSAGKEGAAGKIGVDSIQQLIREIRESVAQQVRREIYQELLAAASPQDSSSRQKPL